MPLLPRFMEPPPFESNPAVEGSEADTLVNKAAWLIHRGKVDEAGSLLRQALAADPDHLQGRYNHALLAWRAGAATDDWAEQHVRDLLDLRPKDWQVFLALAWINLERGLTALGKLCLDDVKLLAGPLESAEQLQAQGRAAVAPGFKITDTLPGHDAPMTRVAVGGKAAYSGGLDGSVRRWDLTASEGRALEAVHRDRITDLQVVVGGLLSASLDGTVRRWSADGRPGAVLSPGGTGITAARLEGKVLVAAGTDGRIFLWDATTGKLVRSWNGHEGAATSLALSAARGKVWTGGEDGLLKEWELATGRLAQAYEGHSGPITSTVLSSDGATAVTGSEDLELRVWSPGKPGSGRVLRGHVLGVLDAAVDATGALVVSCSTEGGLRFWIVSAQRCLRTFLGSPGDATCVALDETGRRVLFGDEAGELKVLPIPETLPTAPPLAVRELPFDPTEPPPPARGPGIVESGGRMP